MQMGVSVAPSRLKREDCKRTKHDSVFSDWKVLIGPSDWEDHSMGKEGVERYRVHNLPNCSSWSGLYELGLAAPRSRSGRETSKLDPDRVIPVYLGQAENVRTRLQRYGREGAHLETGKSTTELNDSVQHGLGLFSEIFSRGYSVAYRWAPMKSKRDAEKTEAQLLDTFDYAWNKGSNGFRRPHDILRKLDRRTSPNIRFPAIVRRLLTFHAKEKGIKIEASNPPLLGNGSISLSNQENNNLFPRILKIGRSQPKLVAVRHDFNEDPAIICGVALGHGSVCRRLPVEGRKRCAEHKGMKVNGFTSKLIIEEKPPIEEVTVDSGVIAGKDCEGHSAWSFSYDKVKAQPVGGNCPVGRDSFFPTCGVTLDDGTLCRKQPVQTRKRCEEHKGRKIARSHKPHKVHSPVFSEKPIISKTDTICGVDLKDRTVCIRQPVIGRKRCEEHKGRRVTGSKSNFPIADIPIVL